MFGSGSSGSRPNSNRFFRGRGVVDKNSSNNSYNLRSAARVKTDQEQHLQEQNDRKNTSTAANAAAADLPVDNGNINYSNIKNSVNDGIYDHDSAIVALLKQPKLQGAGAQVSQQKQDQYPYTAISLSPCRNYAVTACKDAMQILKVGPMGLKVIKTLLVSQYFQLPTTSGSNASTSTQAKSSGTSNIGTIMDSSLFTRVVDSNNPTQTSSTTMINVIITDVAWSNVSTTTFNENRSAAASPHNPRSTKDEMSAAASALDMNDADDDDEDDDDVPNDDYVAQTLMDNHGNNVNTSTSASSSNDSTSKQHQKQQQQKKKKNAKRPKHVRRHGPTENSRGSFIAAAGSNGSIVIWNAETILESFFPTQTPVNAVAAEQQQQKQSGPNFGQNQQYPLSPEAVLNHHGREVSRLAWHPNKHGLLLSASQDGTVRLWERRKQNSYPKDDATMDDASKLAQRDQQHHHMRGGSMFSNFSLFGGGSGGGGMLPRSYSIPTAGGGSTFMLGQGTIIPGQQQQQQQRGGQHHPNIIKKSTYQWHHHATYEPKSEAIRDIKWSPYYDDVFALVTRSGWLIAYNLCLAGRALVKISAHSVDATALDWHPLKPNIIATGGAADRCIKIWDLDVFLSFLTHGKDDNNISANANTFSSRADSVLSDSSGNESYNQAASIGASSGFHYGSTMRTISSSSTIQNSSRHKGAPNYMLYVLSISAAVTRIRWRPPAYDTSGDGRDSEEDRHGSMMAVATAPVKGAVAGGSGMLALWSYHRPFMPLSVVEGHREGAVTDFCWLETPQKEQSRTNQSSDQNPKDGRSNRRGQPQGIVDSRSEVPHLPSNRSSPMIRDHDRILKNIAEGREAEDDGSNDVDIWQHILSVGRDGNCMIQSFVRGDRPISRVPPSCFAMANLSPFQKGYGSLQILSVCQKVPSSRALDFELTGLRKDYVTANAPGIFREVPPPDVIAVGKVSSLAADWVVGSRLPGSDPQIMFNVIDQGELDDDLMPINDEEKAMIIGPEVVHMSRFAERYRLYPDDKYQSRVDLCMHNAEVAESLHVRPLAHMWRMIASLLECSRLNGLADGTSLPKNAVQYTMFPIIRSLLEERANAGDVQTCVALCEVLEVLTKEQTVRIPDLDISLVREWYLSYIDLLRDMCLFSHATFLIRSCLDPFINGLNQQSTTFHECCPQCGKALLNHDGVSKDQDTLARRLCKNCRRRVGLCFLCHQPVKGLFVWCPGCGHGGHLECALNWFGGLNSKNLRECCPTGCGHRCNMFQQTECIPKDYIIDARDWIDD